MENTNITYNITCCNAYPSANNDFWQIATYSSSIIPKIGETLYFPHHGSFSVIDVIYHVSDDVDNIELGNQVMFIEVIVKHIDPSGGYFT